MQPRRNVGRYIVGDIGQTKWKRRTHKFAGVRLAADDFQIFRGEEAGERQEASLWPLGIQEMVVTTGALHARSQEHLRGVGRGLNGLQMIRIQNEGWVHGIVAIHFFRNRLLIVRHEWINQFGGHDVVWLVAEKARVNPFLIVAVADDAAYHSGIGAGDGFFPKRGPVGGVVGVAREQSVNQFFTFAGGPVGEKSLRFFDGWDDADYIQIDAPQKFSVAG